MFGQELRQAAAARQRAQATAQRSVNSSPIFARRTMDRTRVERWPATGSTKVGVGPFENERDGEWRMKTAVTMPNAALFPKQLSERTAAGKSAMAFSQGH